MPDDDAICLNGINALTGEYLVAPLTVEEAGRRAAGGAAPTAERAGWLRRLAKKLTGKFFGLPADVDPTDLAQAGWGVVFAKETPEDVRAALKPLLDRRAAQAGPLFRVLELQPGETREAWLARHKVHGSDVNPAAVPYYLLLVGTPEQIPFEFQYLLDIDYAVGRVAFDDPADYGRYAAAVVASETAEAAPPAREVVYWGTRHPMDRATQLSADKLIAPLSGAGATDPTVAEKYGFRTRSFRAADATKANLRAALDARPALLFTASHGMGGWPKGDPRQRPASGALLCQDWPGYGAVSANHYLAAADLGPDTRLDGTIAVVFACYGAGTPRYDPFLTAPTGGPVEVAEAPFVSALGQRLLAAGALAVVGHIDRAWGYSLEAKGAGAQIQPFRNLLARVLRGDPVGQGTIDFSQRFATYSAELLNRLDPTAPGARSAADPKLAQAWVERNDAQSYVVLGDPAVRVRKDGG
ncbi:MAG: hypothetical protein U0804_13480 [Gemmataceae bacterium]